MIDLTDEELVKRLRGVTIDYDGSRMSDVEAPRGPGVNCGEARQAADRIEALKADAEAMAEALNGLKNNAKGLSYEEDAIREIIGNTNWSVHEHWIEQAEQALAAYRANQGEGE